MTRRRKKVDPVVARRRRLILEGIGLTALLGVATVLVILAL